MKTMTLSPCGRFVVLDGLHLDRGVFESLERWAERHHVRVQDAIQLAVCALGEEAPASARAMPLPAGAPACPPSVGRLG